MRRVKLFVYLAMLMTVVIFAACERNTVDTLHQEQPELVLQAKAGVVTFNGREMAFDNFETFYEYQTKINEDIDFRKDIYKKYAGKLAIGQSKTTSFKKKFLFERLTNDYLYSVNAEGMVLISGELIRFDEKYQYAVPEKNRSLLAVSNEAHIDLSLVKRDSYGFTDPKSGLPNSRTQISLPGNGSNAHQYTFAVQAPDPYAGQSRRVTHELFGHRGANVGGVTQHRLIIRFKMEYPGSGSSWYEVNEPRIIDYLVNFDFTFSQQGQTPYIVSNRQVNNYQTTTNLEERVIGNKYSYSNAYGTWDATITGYITTKLISPNNYNYSRTSGANVGFPYPQIW